MRIVHIGTDPVFVICFYVIYDNDLRKRRKANLVSGLAVLHLTENVVALTCIFCISKNGVSVSTT